MCHNWFYLLRTFPERRLVPCSCCKEQRLPIHPVRLFVCLFFRFLSSSSNISKKFSNSVFLFSQSTWENSVAAAAVLEYIPYFIFNIKNKNGSTLVIEPFLSVWCGKWDLNPYVKDTRPSHVPVCQFQHCRIYHFYQR